MRIKYAKRVMAFLMIIMMVMVSMPVSYANIYEAVRTSVAGSFDSVRGFGQVVMAESELGPETDSTHTITFEYPARAILIIDFINTTETTQYIGGGSHVLERPVGTIIDVSFDDSETGTTFENVRFRFDGDGNNVKRDSEFSTDAGNNPFRITMGNVESYDVEGPVDDTGKIVWVTSWKDALSNEAGLKSVDPITDPNVSATTYNYDILVESLDNRPTLNPVATHPGATISETDSIDKSLTTVVVTSEDGQNSETYYFNFIVRAKPYLVLLGNNPDEVVKSTGSYSDPMANAFNADGADGQVAGVGTVDMTTEGVYTLTYDYTDPVQVYRGNDLVNMVADQLTRTVNVVDAIIVDPEGQEISVEGYTLYFGTAVTSADGEADLDVIAPNAQDPTELWEFVGNDLGIISLGSTDGFIQQLGVVGSQEIMVTVDGSTDEAMIHVESNFIPVINMNGDATVDVYLGETYTDAGATAQDFEDVTVPVDVVNPVNVNQIGVYTVTYNATDSDSNSAVEVTRTVNVIKRPVTGVEITDPNGFVIDTDGYTLYIGDMAVPGTDEVNLDAMITPPNASYLDEFWSTSDATTVEVLDEAVGTLKGHKVGTAEITVEVDGVTDTVDVHVVSNNKPVIDLNGVTEINVPLNGVFINPPVTAFDIEDLDITSSIVETGTVNTNIAGTYVLYYNVTDSDENPADEAMRIVRVYSDYIISVEELDPIYVPEGELPDGLPTTAQAQLYLGGTTTVGLDFGDLGPVYEDMILTGTLTDLEPGVANTIPVYAYQPIIVQRTIIVDPPNYDVEAENIMLYVGYGRTDDEGKALLDYTVYPEGLTPNSVEWTIVDADPDVTITVVDGVATVYGVEKGVAGTRYAQVRVDLAFYDDLYLEDTAYNEFTLSDTINITIIESVYVPPYTPPYTPPVIGVTLDTDLVTLDYGEGADPDFLFYDFTETVTGTNDKRVTWSLDDDTYATVDENGVVTARDDIPVDTGEFTVILTVTTVIGGATDTAEILFLEPTPLGAIEFYDPYVFGYPENIFGPERYVTRAEVATMFAKILKMNLDFPGSQKFNDVAPDVWYYQYVQAIYRTKIFVGDGNGSFRPNDPISRAEIATVFSKLWEFTDIEVDDTPVLLPDVNASHWASSYIYKMYNSGMVGGFDDGTYRPNENTLRDQFVVMVNKLIDRPQYLAPFTKYVDVEPEHWAYGDIEAATQPFVVGNELQEE